MKKIIYIVAVLTALVSCEKSEKDVISDNDRMAAVNPWVDLGLPSGKLWASMNVGAKSLTDAGDFYAWGELEPKTDYSWSTYKFWDGTYEKSSQTSYVEVYGTTKYGKAYYELGQLEAEDDVCTVKYGELAHTPSIAEWREMFDNTTDEYQLIDGVPCLVFKSKNNSSFIVFPFGGAMSGTKYCPFSPYSEKTSPLQAWLWTSNVVPEDGFCPNSHADNATRVIFSGTIYIINGERYDPNTNLSGSSKRCYGMNVRAVKSK